MSPLEIVGTVLGVVATVLADLRWLRVAQREHYLAGSASRFAWRWWSVDVRNAALGTVAVIGVGAATVVGGAALVAALAVALGPLGLGLRGRTSRLVWTARCRRLAAVLGLLQVVVLEAGVIGGAPSAVAAGLGLFAPLLVDVALALTSPWERRRSQRFVTAARRRLASVSPRVVAITGSYGKTSTKQYVAHLVGTTTSVMATPASFNNRNGLSRAINEQLAPGTDVFVAEMGTYGPGEIGDLCELCPPTVAVLTAIGPVHLERFGSEDAIVAAKREIFATASICVLNVDDARLAQVAAELEAEGKDVWRCGSVATDLDVRVVEDGGKLLVDLRGERIAEADGLDAPPTNVACAVAAAVALGVARSSIAAALPTLPVAQHRQSVSRSDGGVVVIDDTFNANPASVRRGLALLARHAAPDGRRIVVTPGMVELGPRQRDENEAFGAAAASAATDLVLVGRTNRRALLAGARGAGGAPVVVETLAQAVAWVREHGSPGDAVLYANDLPDHFP